MSTLPADLEPDPGSPFGPADGPTTGSGSAPDRTGHLLEVHLAKYNSLRAEVFQRFGFQQQTINFLLVALAAMAAAAASLRADRPELEGLLILAVPLVTGPLGRLYLANELIIFGVLGYVRRELSADVSRLLGRPVSLSDLRFDSLLSISRLVHRLLPQGRWLLFLLPTIGPVVYAAFFTGLWRTPPFAILWWADVAVALALVGAVVATTREEAAWRRPPDANAAPVARGDEQQAGGEMRRQAGPGASCFL